MNNKFRKVIPFDEFLWEGLKEKRITARDYIEMVARYDPNDTTISGEQYCSSDNWYNKFFNPYDGLDNPKKK